MLLLTEVRLMLDVWRYVIGMQRIKRAAVMGLTGLYKPLFSRNWRLNDSCASFRLTKSNYACLNTLLSFTTIISKYPYISYEYTINSLRPRDAQIRQQTMPLFRRETIIWTNAGLLLIVSLLTSVNLKMPSAKWRPRCRHPNVLILPWLQIMCHLCMNW